jgi:two-component system response regulator HydG
VCNCAALTETLLESQLFGYARGAFTGAVTDSSGIFEHAHGGTVFLDEIGELRLEAQAKLLRVLQNGEVQRIGTPKPRSVDVRVIAATHRNLPEMVRSRAFREDLYYRLNVFEIRLPSLAARREDVYALADCFVQRFREKFAKPLLGLTPEVRAMFRHYSWPGNVRELENVLEYACLIAQDPWISAADLPPAFLDGQSSDSNNAHPADANDPDEWPKPYLRPLDDVVRDHILFVLRRVQGDRTKASQILGIGRTTLYRKINDNPITESVTNDRPPLRRTNNLLTVPIATPCPEGSESVC